MSCEGWGAVTDLFLLDLRSEMGKSSVRMWRGSHQMASVFTVKEKQGFLKGTKHIDGTY